MRPLVRLKLGRPEPQLPRKAENKERQRHVGARMNDVSLCISTYILRSHEVRVALGFQSTALLTMYL